MVFLFHPLIANRIHPCCPTSKVERIPIHIMVQGNFLLRQISFVSHFPDAKTITTFITPSLITLPGQPLDHLKPAHYLSLRYLGTPCQVLVRIRSLMDILNVGPVLKDIARVLYVAWCQLV